MVDLLKTSINLHSVHIPKAIIAELISRSKEENGKQFEFKISLSFKALILSPVHNHQKIEGIGIRCLEVDSDYYLY